MSATPVVLRPLEAEDTLFRAMRNSKWLDELTDAFMLRHDEVGLSVAYDCEPAHCCRGLRKSFGVASLTVECVLKQRLEVVPDAIDHAHIMGLPHKEVDPNTAEFLATRLAECATIVDRERRQT